MKDALIALRKGIGALPASLGLTPTAYGVLWLHIGLLFLCDLALPLKGSLVEESVRLTLTSLIWIFLAGTYIVLHALYTILSSIITDTRPRTAGRYYGSILLTTTTICLFFKSFCHLKSLLSLVMPYYLDPYLHQLDLLLLGNTTAFEWLAPHCSATCFHWVDTLYWYLWIGIMLSYLWVHMLMPQTKPQRTVFLSSYVMVWVIEGILLATLGASVGPTYYPEFYQDAFSERLGGVIDSLRAIHEITPLQDAVTARDWVLTMQRALPAIGENGPSAMPSLHTGIMGVIAAHSYYYYRRLLWILIPATLFMCVGSVLLGWHYATDSIISIPLAILIVRWNRRMSLKAGK